jgi:hypothetical protein
MLQGGDAQGLWQDKSENWWHRQKMGMVEHLIMLVPRILFLCSLFMFGLIDLTHGYLWESFWALCAGVIIFLGWRGRIFAGSDSALTRFI